MIPAFAETGRSFETPLERLLRMSGGLVMSAKITAARRNAFLKALGETGNQTLSAERAKVSRSWVCLHRDSDPDFDAACRAAIGAAQERLTHSPHPAGASRESLSPAEGRGDNRPPSGWGYLDGAELVVRGSKGRRVQIGRARVRQWTARVEARFLTALAATCNVKAACAEVAMWPGSAYAHRKRWPGFAARWDAAIDEGYARIELALVEQGCNLFSAPELSSPTALGPMSVDQAIHLLHMHKHAVKRLGKAPGVSWRPATTLDEVSDGILRKIAAIARGRGVSEANKARDRRDYARRR